jgi:hypothetical protein
MIKNQKKKKSYRKKLLERVLKRTERQISNNGSLPRVLFTPKDGIEPSQLSSEERKLLRKQDRIIARAVKQGDSQHFELAKALAIVHRKKLYKDYGKGGFIAYCRKYHGIGKTQAYRAIESARIMEILSPHGNTLPRLPTQQAQLRPLAGLPADAIIAIWRVVVEEAGSARITRRMVRRKKVEWQNGQKGIALSPGGIPVKPMRLSAKEARYWLSQLGHAITFVDQDQKEHALETLSQLRRMMSEAANAYYLAKHGILGPSPVEDDYDI